MEADEAGVDGQGGLEDELSALNPSISITSAEELFKAVEFGVLNKTEARRLLGLETGRGRSARGQLRGSRGRFASSDRVAQHRAMLDDAARLGQDHPEALLAKSSLARVLASEGELSEARRLLDEVLVGWKDRLGVSDPATLLAMSDLASVLTDEGVLSDKHELERARKLQEYVLRHYRESLGVGHPDTLTAQRNLAGTLRAQGRLAEAYQLEVRALDIGRQSGAEIPTVLEVARVESGVPESQSTTIPGLVRAARELEIQVLQAGQRADDPELLASAQRVQEEIVVFYQQTLGENHPLTANAKMHLAVVLALQGQEASAQQLLEELMRQVEPEIRPLDRLLAKIYLATRPSGRDEPVAAQRVYKQILEGYRAEFDEDNPSTVIMKLYLATVLADQGSPDARQLQEEVVGSYGKIVGEDHQTVAAMRALWFGAPVNQSQPAVVNTSEGGDSRTNVPADRRPAERLDDDSAVEDAAEMRVESSYGERPATSSKPSARGQGSRSRSRSRSRQSS